MLLLTPKMTFTVSHIDMEFSALVGYHSASVYQRKASFLISRHINYKQDAREKTLYVVPPYLAPSSLGVGNLVLALDLCLRNSFPPTQITRASIVGLPARNPRNPQDPILGAVSDHK